MNREEYLLKPFIDNADLMKDRVAAGIEANRKGRVHFRVVDKEGKPVPGVRIRYNQRTHDFHYGANLFMLDEFETEEKNAAYREAFKDHFNFATLPFYWDTLEPEEGKPRYDKNSPKVYRRPAPDLCLEYCEANGITPKAHCLNYDHFCPEWLNKYTAEQQWHLLEQRFQQCADRYARRIPGWEVTNESYWGHSTTKMYFDPLFMERSFRMAERIFPQNELICNEGGEPFREPFRYNRNPYFMQIERAKLKGARIDTVGFQYHIWSNPQNEEEVVSHQCDLENMFRVFDTFQDAFHCPMQMTEVTFPCHDPHSKEAEDLQAELLKNLYTVWFSVPNMEAIIYWNLVDGYAYGATPGDFNNGENRLAGGLMHFDLTPKPALKMIRSLFNDVWHTQGEAVSAADGSVVIKGFYGEYDVEIIANGKSEKRSYHLEKKPSFRVDFGLPTLTVG